MPVYLIYVLIALAISSAAGVGFALGNILIAILSLVGAGFIITILWNPLIKPFIQKGIKQ